MTQALTNHTLPKAYPVSVEWDRRLTSLHRRLEEHGFRQFSFPRGECGPDEHERRQLAERKEHLDRWLEPASKRLIEAEVAALFAVMAYRGGDETDMAVVQRIYREDLAGIPGFALSQACARFRRGEVGDVKFVPKPGELRKEADNIAFPYFEERRKTRDVLSAEVPKQIEPGFKRFAGVPPVEEWKFQIKPMFQSSIPENEKLLGMQAPKRDPRDGLTEEQRRSYETQRLEELHERISREPLPQLSAEALGTIAAKGGPPPYVEAE
jgi:hypothetical protein